MQNSGKAKLKNTKILFGRSRRGKPRGPPGSRELQTALKGKTTSMSMIYIAGSVICTQHISGCDICTQYIAGCEDPLFTDFIRRCLEWDPATRMTPNAALRYHQLIHSKSQLTNIISDDILTNASLRHAWLRRRLPRPPQVEPPTLSHHLLCITYDVFLTKKIL